MKVYDISVPLRAGMPTYEGEPGPELTYRSLLSRGDSATVSVLSLGSHTGTHIDAPAHFLEGGTTVEQAPLDSLVGPAHVVEFGGDEHITAHDIAAMGLPAAVERVLFKTHNGRLWDDPSFHRDFLALAPDAALDLVRRGVRLVGIDYLSIERFHPERHEVHETLLGAGVVVLEGLDLRRVEPGEYILVCAPLNVVGAEGAPARAFLIEGQDILESIPKVRPAPRPA